MSSMSVISPVNLVRNRMGFNRSNEGGLDTLCGRPHVVLLHQTRGLETGDLSIGYIQPVLLAVYVLLGLFHLHLSFSLFTAPAAGDAGRRKRGALPPANKNMFHRKI